MVSAKEKMNQDYCLAKATLDKLGKDLYEE